MSLCQSDEILKLIKTNKKEKEKIVLVGGLLVDFQWPEQRQLGIICVSLRARKTSEEDLAKQQVGRKKSQKQLQCDSNFSLSVSSLLCKRFKYPREAKVSLECFGPTNQPKSQAACLCLSVQVADWRAQDFQTFHNHHHLQRDAK